MAATPTASPVAVTTQRHPTTSSGLEGSSHTAKPSLSHRFCFGPGGAATLAGTCEIIIFHPFDTVAKRLMAHRRRVVDPLSFRGTCHNIYDVIFGELHKPAAGSAETTARRSSTLFQKVHHLYPGSKYAVMYKVSQRVIKFAGQPMARDYMFRHHHSLFFGKEAPAVRGSGAGVKKSDGRGALMLESCAGCFVGVSETILLPFDRMKVLKQTNKTAVQNHGLIRAMLEQGPQKLYAGAMTTATRNAVGCFLLFGGTAFTKEYVFRLHGNYRDATFFQNLVSSSVGGVIGVIATSPMDVIKTRIQGQSWHESSSGWRIFRETCQKEGFAAFYKGITPKVLTSAPKLVFGYTMTQYFLKFLKPPQKDANPQQQVK
eukprot:gene10320-7215_t